MVFFRKNGYSDKGRQIAAIAHAQEMPPCRFGAGICSKPNDNYAGLKKSMTGNKLFNKYMYLLAAVCAGMLAALQISDIVSFLSDELVTIRGALYCGAVVFSVAAVMIIVLKTDILLCLGRPALFGVLLVLVSFGLKALFVLLVKTQQYSDFQLLYETTVQIAENRPRYLEQPYFFIWAYQTGFPAMMSVFLRLPGANIHTLVLINCLFMAVSNLFVYLTARLFSSEKIARLIALLFMIYPLNLGLCTVYTNQHPADLLYWAGIYLLLKKAAGKMIRYIMAGVLFALGNAVRPEGIVIIAAIIIWMVLYNPRMRVPDEPGAVRRRIWARAVTVIVVFLLGTQIISQVFIISGLNPSGLKNEFPLYKFAVGLNQETGGAYSKEDADLLFSSAYYQQHPDLRNEKTAQIIKDRLLVPQEQLMNLWNNKIHTFWVYNASYPALTGMQESSYLRCGQFSIEAGRLKNLMRLTDMLLMSMIFALCAVSAFSAVRAGQSEPRQFFLSALFLAVFFIYLLIEVQMRYRLFVMPAVFLLSAAALEKISWKKGEGRDK